MHAFQHLAIKRPTSSASCESLSKKQVHTRKLTHQSAIYLFVTTPLTHCIIGFITTVTIMTSESVPLPSLVSSAVALGGFVAAEAGRRREELKIAAAVIAGLAALRCAWGLYASRRDPDLDDDAFKPLSAGEVFESAMRRAEAQFRVLQQNVAELTVERQSLFDSLRLASGDESDEAEIRTVWRKQSAQRHIMNDELITKLLIEVDGIGIPAELVVDLMEEAQHSVVPQAVDARGRRKGLIRDLHALSVDLNALQ